MWLVHLRSYIPSKKRGQWSKQDVYHFHLIFKYCHILLHVSQQTASQFAMSNKPLCGCGSMRNKYNDEQSWKWPNLGFLYAIWDVWVHVKARLVCRSIYYLSLIKLSQVQQRGSGSRGRPGRPPHPDPFQILIRKDGRAANEPAAKKQTITPFPPVPTVKYSLFLFDSIILISVTNSTQCEY